jgi:hypothetical protein
MRFLYILSFVLSFIVFLFVDEPYSKTGDLVFLIMVTAFTSVIIYLHFCGRLMLAELITFIVILFGVVGVFAVLLYSSNTDLTIPIGLPFFMVTGAVFERILEARARRVEQSREDTKKEM